MEDKQIKIKTDYQRQQIEIGFSKNLEDSDERGYILSAALMSYCAGINMDKQELIELIDSHYDAYTKPKDDSLFGKLAD